MAYDKIAGTASGEMMLRYMADRIIKSVDGAIGHNMWLATTSSDSWTETTLLKWSDDTMEDVRRDD